MRGESFDRLTRAMATGSSRRGMLKALAAGVASVVGGTLRPRSMLAGATMRVPTGPALPGQPCVGATLTAVQYQALQTCCATQGPIGSAAWGACIALGECGQGACAGICQNAGNCNAGFSACQNSSQGCVCFTNSSGSGTCIENFLCDEVNPCTNGTCPSGFICIVNTACDGCAGSGSCIPAGCVCSNGAPTGSCPPGAGFGARPASGPRKRTATGR